MRIPLGFTVKLLVACLLVNHLVCADDHTGSGGNDFSRGQNREKPRGGACDGFPPEYLTELSNQETSNADPIGPFLFSPDCTRDKKEVIIKQAIKEGIQFKEFPDLNLQLMVNQKNLSNKKEMEELDVFLKTRIPDYLTEEDLPEKDLIPLTAQLAVLSPDSAKYAYIDYLGAVISNAANKYDVASSDKDKVQIIEQLSSKLLKMDVQEDAVRDFFAKYVEEKAVLAQADSLSNIFQMVGLSAIQTNNQDLAQLFDHAAFAFSNVVQKGKDVYTPQQKSKLLLASLAGLTVGSQSDLLEQGMLELHQALSPFSDTFKLYAQKKRLWKAITKILVQNVNLPILASLYMESLSMDAFRLPKAEKAMVLETSRNYPEISKRIQHLWVNAYEERMKVLEEEESPPPFYANDVEKNLIPLVSEIFERDPETFDPTWLQIIQERNLIPEEVIEKKYPRMALKLITNRETNVQTNEDAIRSLWVNSESLYTLTTGVVPPLAAWVQKREARNSN